MFTGIVEELGEIVFVEKTAIASDTRFARVTIRGPEVTSDAAHGDSIAGSTAIDSSAKPGAGVPLLVSPICNDQPHNARLVAGAGAGQVCDLAVAGVGEVRERLSALYADGPARACAGRIAHSYRAAGGAAAVADAVERLCI